MIKNKMKTIDKRSFFPPRILREERLLLEQELMAASIYDNIEGIRAAGQETETLDFSGSSFNHNWEEN